MRSLRFHIPTATVSQQASGSSKAQLKEAVRKAISKTEVFLTGEVRLSVDWMIHDRIRYETDTAPDVDNILKPTIDALTGPDGILIDDCQVQRVNCGWIDWTSEEQAFDVEIEYFEDEMISSRDIFFVQFANGLCFPFERDLPNEITETLVQHLNDRLAARDAIASLTGNYHTALYVMPIQRFFHRTRIQGFPVLPHTQFMTNKPQDTG